MTKRTRPTAEQLDQIIALLLGIAGITPFENLTAQVGVGPGLLGVFSCTQAYVPGSLRVYKNGLLCAPGAGNDYIETNATAGEFTFEAAVIPSGMDQVWVTYTPNP